MIGLLAGGYARAGSAGLQALAYSSNDDRLVASPPGCEVVNVSAAVRIGAPDDRWLVVDEVAGEVVEIAPGPEGWIERARRRSGGRGPCHLALDPTGSWLAVAHYDSGDVALHRVDPATSSVFGDADVRASFGSGPNRDRQAAPHVHWVGFAPISARLYATDLGSDRVLVFDPDASGGIGPMRTAFVAPAGSGPRQIGWSPSRPLAFLVSELASTVSVLRIEPDGELTPVGSVSTLPPGAAPGSLGGAIVVNAAGDRLYVSNRGDDSVAAFAVGADGDLQHLGVCKSGGASPRFLLLLEDAARLLVAHEKTGGVCALPIDASGRLGAPVARADAPGAACLVRTGDSGP